MISIIPDILRIEKSIKSINEEPVDFPVEM